MAKRADTEYTDHLQKTCHPNYFSNTYTLNKVYDSYGYTETLSELTSGRSCHFTREDLRPLSLGLRTTSLLAQVLDLVGRKLQSLQEEREARTEKAQTAVGNGRCLHKEQRHREN